MKQHTERNAIAIVGLGAVLPDADDVGQFWNNLSAGRYSIGDVPADRWSTDLYYDADPSAPDKAYSKIGGFVRDLKWEPLKWRLPIPPKVAGAMDRAQKYGIIAVREAVAHYGKELDRARTAVIFGSAMGGDRHYQTSARIMFPEFAASLAGTDSFDALPADTRADLLREMAAKVAERFPQISEDTMPGELANIIAGRVAALFDFKGPNFTTDAACASAMAAMNAAVEGLVEGDFDSVLTGGVDANMSPTSYIKFCKIGALSATGTRPFDAGADGFVMGEGAAVFLLRRLEDAERDGDDIYAVIRGFGASSDGKGKGITAPNPAGQRLAVQRAWENAGVSPQSCTMMEAHGTSTRVGDVVETDTLATVFADFGLPLASVSLGSVKSNIGHLKAAAGAAGVLKSTLALHHKQLPPSLGFQTPNPKISWSASPFAVNTEHRPWDHTVDGIRRAGISSFGFGGTNFHAVLEEYIPGRIADQRRRQVAMRDAALTPPTAMTSAAATTPAAPVAAKTPPRGLVVLGAADDENLAKRLEQLAADAARGVIPEARAPARADVTAPVRLAIDYADADELTARCAAATKALAANQPAAWRALRGRGIFRGAGTPGKVAFLFPGQGSQYVNMLAGMAKSDPVVGRTIAEADGVMTPLLGRPLTDLLYADPDDSDAMKAADAAIRQTEVTQPAMLAVDVALHRLLDSYGIQPDMVMGHSLGEYGALVAAGVMDFDAALTAVSARGTEMARVSMDDNGAMVAVFGDLQQIKEVVEQTEGYLVVANVNSHKQVVVGGATEAVERVTAAFGKAGMRAIPLPVSHAFHTSIVAPASEPLKRVLATLGLHDPVLPVISNVSGQFHPMGDGVVDEIIDLLGQQIASPVQFVDGLETLYAEGARIFVEVGPKRALTGMVSDVLGDRDGVVALATNHPKTGEVASFNHALAGLYAAGIGGVSAPAVQTQLVSAPVAAPLPAAPAPVVALQTPAPGSPAGLEQLGRVLADAMARAGVAVGSPAAVDALPPNVITGAGLGLPGTERVFDDRNVARILAGESLIEAIPLKLRHSILAKRITRLVKGDGGPRFETLDSLDDVIKLAGRAGRFELDEEFGVPSERVVAFDRTTCLAMAAGIEAMRDAGLPLVMRYKTTSTGSQLPDRWMLPEALRDDTGVIFGSAFPGMDSLAEDAARYHEAQARQDRLDELLSLRDWLPAEVGAAVRRELDSRIDGVRAQIDAADYKFDRRYLFRILSMGHSQFAEYIGARGPNTQLNAACASGPQAVAMADDWIRTGRCKRVICITADDVTTDRLMGWIGAGFLASGAAATDAHVEDAALPFDRRRHGMLTGMGAAAMIVERSDVARSRGIRPICEILGTVTLNSAFHGTRLDIEHIGGVMEALVQKAEREHGLQRAQMAPETVFVSHETYTPARGGSAAAEINALRRVFGPGADQVVIANTKGFTGHAMAAAVEDVVGIKILETGIVPPVANYKEPDPELGRLNLSRGGTYPVRYVLRLAAGFGSQLSMSLLRWTPSPSGQRTAPHALGYQSRVEDGATWQRWLAAISGADAPELEVALRTLRIKDPRGARLGAPGRAAPRAQSKPSAPSTPKAALPPVTSAPAVAAKAAPVPQGAPQPIAAPPAPSAQAPAGGQSAVLERVMAIVAVQTGYPADMLEPDLDLEADLGIDTVKQAEMFAAVRGEYDLPRDENLNLRDFPTLEHVVGWVLSQRPELGTAPAASTAAPAASTAAPAVAPPATCPPKKWPRTWRPRWRR